MQGPPDSDTPELQAYASALDLRLSLLTLLAEVGNMSVQGKKEKSLASKPGARSHSKASAPFASSMPEYIVSAVVLHRQVFLQSTLLGGTTSNDMLPAIASQLGGTNSNDTMSAIASQL